MNTPRFAHDWDFLLAVARDLHANRVIGYPPAVEKGLMTAAEAELGLRVTAAIVNDWLAFIAHKPLPADGATLAEKREDLARTCQRAAERAASAPNNRPVADYAACLHALAWHYEPWAPGMALPRIDLLNTITIEGRRRVVPIREAA